MTRAFAKNIFRRHHGTFFVVIMGHFSSSSWDIFRRHHGTGPLDRQLELWNFSRTPCVITTSSWMFFFVPPLHLRSNTLCHYSSLILLALHLYSTLICHPLTLLNVNCIRWFNKGEKTTAKHTTLAQQPLLPQPLLLLRPFLSCLFCLRP